MNALRRGVELSKGSRGRIFVLGLLVGAIKLGVVAISQVFFLVTAFRHHGQMGAGLTAASQVIGFFTSIFLGPIYATGITLLYYDQRVRHEGYDIEWMMQTAGLTLPPSVAPSTLAAGAESASYAQTDPGAAAHPDSSDEPSRREEPEGEHG